LQGEKKEGIVEKRKTVETQNLKKQSPFLKKRFGENDSN
jgi:hypothetical protein